MTYKLYRAKDTRDNRIMLWLHDTRNRKAAQFHTKTAPTRIKRLTTVAPGGITWSTDSDFDIFATDVQLIEGWN